VDFTADGIAFTYTAPEIRSVHPVLGPVHGGTVVTIAVTLVPVSNSMLRCSFAAAVVPATSRGSAHALCVSPRSTPGAAQLTVQLLSHGSSAPSHHGTLNFETIAVASFEYVPDVYIRAVLPNSGPVFGGTLVTLVGRHFMPTFDPWLHCYFGQLSTFATYVNASMMLCRTPRHAASSVSLEVTLGSTLGGQGFSRSGIAFAFVAFQITHLIPARAPASGGTTIVVYLDSEVDATPFSCQFGHAPPSAAARSSVANQLLCRTPSHATGRVPFLLMARSDNASAKFTFEFVREPYILSIVPRRGLVTSPTPVYVHGEGFVNSSSLTCAFGSARSNASFIDNRTALCMAPEYVGPRLAGSLVVPVRVSTNAHDFSRSYTTFEYIACPRGTWCPQLEVVPCPPGAFCPSAGSNFTACPPGTFRANDRSASCSPCPPGYFCPSQGLSSPLLCAAGMVCSLSGLSFPDSFCPSGHFCPLGVSTSNPTSSSSTMAPQECPENTWCPAGVASNVSIPGNYSTPQPCVAGFVCFRGSDNPQGSGPCPAGYFCPPGSLPIECPQANYCPGVGNVFPSLCTPGFYNDKTGQDKCTECPIGYICDKVGLSSPTICPAGSVCNEPGLQVPATACPPGYYCWEGTETADWNSEGNFKPIACPKAVYCLGGITSNLTDENDYRSPQPCTLGQYCKEASTSPFGTGRCPAGFFCPKGTANPYPSPAGFFSRGEGKSQAIPCLAGTWSKYNPLNGTDTCFLCPGGYSCAEEGTIEPLPCSPGTFRAYNGTVSCQQCPEGSWNPYYANPMEMLCMPCPRGRVCGVKGMTNLSQSDPCPAGHMCDWNTSSSTKYDDPCLPGYYCDRESHRGHLECASTAAVRQVRALIEQQMTSVDDPICTDLGTIGTTQRTDGRRCYCPIGLCPAGYICYAATSADTRTGNPCLEGYYCPEGTSPERMEAEYKCPDGTSSLPKSMASTDCFRIDARVTSAITTATIPGIFRDPDALVAFEDYIVTDPAFVCRPFPDPPSCEAEVPSTRRRLSLERIGKNLSGISTSDGSAAALLQTAALELEDALHSADEQLERRNYSMNARLLQSEPSARSAYLGEPPAFTVFRLPPFTMARFVFDLAGKLPQELVYSDHYRFGVFVDGHKHSSPYPPSFGFDMPVDEDYAMYKSHRWSKTSRFALHLHSMKEVLFRLELQILHGLYTDKVSLFERSMDMEILPDVNLPWGPDRGHPGRYRADGSLSRRVFLIGLDKERQALALPLNLPRLLPTKEIYLGASYLEPYQSDNVVAVLEYSMINYTLPLGGTGGILMDPLEGVYSADYSAETFWGSSLLTVAPMPNLPYFSLCSRGVRFGRTPSTNNYHADVGQPFTIGCPDAQGGAPVRARGSLVKCKCSDQPRPQFVDVCPPGCTTFKDANGDESRNIDFTPVIFENPSLGPGNDQYHLISEWVVSPRCRNCGSAINGADPGDPYPRDAFYPPTGAILQIPGWDSRAPLTWVLEHPSACHLVSEEDTIHIRQWDIFATRRYSDACDYIMTCMYEERSELFAGKPYWFQAQSDDMLFYMTREPIPTEHVSGGFCFPDLETDAARRQQLERSCGANLRYFSKVKAYMDDENFIFIQADVSLYESERHGMDWTPHRMQLLLQYWQTRDSRIERYAKKLIKGKLILGDFTSVPGETLRGHEYDLRITWFPVAWIDVLDNFALDLSTYLVFYVLLDFVAILAVMLVWGCFRQAATQTNPPRLNFLRWLRGFELNPIIGFTMVLIPIAMVAGFMRGVMLEINPLGSYPGDWGYIGPGALEVTLSVEEKWLSGRVGIMLLCLGFNLMVNGAELLCPRKDMPGSIWRPGFWQRRHVMYTSIWLFIILLLALEVSFSIIFSLYPVPCMLGFRVVWMSMEVWLMQALTEKLIALPFECALQTIQYVMTLGAAGFLAFIQANVVELSVMVFLRVAVQPVNFRVQRLLRFRIAVQQAQRSGAPVPVMTPELEAIGIMSDMLRLMYRFSVDALGSVISPIAVVIIFLFREQFEVSKYYGIRSTDLVYFVLFSAFLVPALWVIDIFLFNVQELLWNWKLFEYIQFCNERFANRSRRWVGLDDTINEELPPDLRALDQMCLSVQFYLLGSLHCSGIVFAVLGYMLVLHQQHNLFGDPMAIPVFLGVSLFLGFAKRVTIRVADRYRIWMVEGEYEHVDTYDEGPGSRKAGALPPGMAAIDASIADCIEDTFAAGYTEDHLAKLLSEAASYVPPGMSIQAIGMGVAGGAETGGCRTSDLSVQMAGPRTAAMGPAYSMLPPPGCATLPPIIGALGTERPMPSPGLVRGAGFVGCSLQASPQATTLPAGVPPPPSALGGSLPWTRVDESDAFAQFIGLFRKEMRQAREQDARATRFVSSFAAPARKVESVEPVEPLARPVMQFSHEPVDNDKGDGHDDDDYDYWPDFGLGVAQDDVQEALSFSTTSTTEGSTAEHIREDSQDDSDDSQDDLWPIELVVGG